MSLSRIIHALVWIWQSLPRKSPSWRSPALALYYFWHERLTFRGKTASAVLVFSFSLAMFPLWGVLEFLTLFLWITLTFSWLRTLKPPSCQPQVKRHMPQNARAGEIRDFCWTLSWPDCEPSSALLSIREFRTPDQIAPVAEDPQNGASLLLCCDAMKFKRRGTYHLQGPTLLWQEPLGLFRSRKVLDDPVVFRVGAEYTPLDWEIFPKEWSLSLVLAGEEKDFAGLRPYQPGDSIRDLHHRAWARRGEPVTRMWQSPPQPRVSLTVHLDFPPFGDRWKWEKYLAWVSAVGELLVRDDKLGQVVLVHGASKKSFEVPLNQQATEDLWFQIVCALPHAPLLVQRKFTWSENLPVPQKQDGAGHSARKAHPITWSLAFESPGKAQEPLGPTEHNPPGSQFSAFFQGWDVSGFKLRFENYGADKAGGNE